MPEWPHRSIRDLCAASLAELQTGPFGAQLHAYDYVPEGIPVVPTEAIRDRRIDHSMLPRVTVAKANELARHRLLPGDILFARRGAQATGQVAYVRSDEDGFICGTGAIRLRIKPSNGEILPAFLSHVLANPAAVAWFKFHAIGATMPNLNERIIRAFSFALPSVDEQRAIATLLDALDDKIELNRWMNETLEAMARAIFKSWFVDFDPVHAKAVEHNAARPSNLASQFLGEVGPSELGPNPAGWRVAALGDVLRILETGRRPRGGVAEITTGVPSVGAESIVGIGQFDFSKTKYVPHEFFDLMSKGHIQDGDVLLYKDGGRPGEFKPHVTMVGDGFPFSTFCINEHVYRLRSDPMLPQSYLFLWLSSNLCMEEMRMRGTGVAIPGLNSTAVRSLAILVPPPDILRAFDDLVLPILRKIFANCNQSRTLAALRDTLLPKLISGELRVKDAERIAADAAA